MNKIMLSRFLEKSPVQAVVAVRGARAVLSEHGLLAGESPALRRVPGTGGAIAAASDATCGRIVIAEGRPSLVLRDECTCEYAIDSPLLAERIAKLGTNERGRVMRAVRTLLLATARSMLTRSLATVLVRVQRRYLLSNDPKRLVPFTAREAVRRVREAGEGLADESRVSRLLRSTSILLPDGTQQKLKVLCPSTRTLLCAFVRAEIDRERNLRNAGRLRRAIADAELARRVARRRGVSTSRRLVSYCRARLGIPGARARSRHGAYSSETRDFSPLHRLDRRSVLRWVPCAQGVYELRVMRREPGHKASCSGVIYVGRATNLKARLLDHAGGWVRNERLLQYLRTARLQFRFRIESRDPRQAEAYLYRRFCESYGNPPQCNRVSP